MTKLPISVIVLTFNEKLNLQECLDSVLNYVDEIIVVDSFSTDSTIEIAKGFTEKIYQNKFVNQSKQFIWALSKHRIKKRMDTSTGCRRALDKRRI